MQIPTESISEFGDDGLDCVVPQAEGMITAQAGVSIAEASLRLDEYCRSHGETKHDVATLIVDRQIRFAH